MDGDENTFRLPIVPSGPSYPWEGEDYPELGRGRFDADGYDEQGWRRTIQPSELRVLEDAFTGWDALPGDTAALEAVLDEAADERPLQRFLSERPHLLALTFLGGGHGRYVRPQVRLGSEWVADFMIAEASSMGLFWKFVEIESPRADLFLKRGEWAEKARHAQHQVATWRQWVKENLDYARKPPRDGLGLLDIEPRPEAVIVIGRRHHLREDCEWMRRSLRADDKIHIATYDHILSAVRASEERTRAQIARAATSEGDRS